MLKWLLVVLVALFVFSGLRGVLSRFGWGKLPGDFSIEIKGRQFQIPLTSTVMLSLLFMLISYLV